ncbi:vicianin hydrolase-like [Impatiens glandulifera]|uniref:vicianin hydrolase-like n=1 Tax=Impatiens glandulifera TaxID=253017 RepID=UPI001FB080FC|nr:vicianin hydrolase-like [Impatiens glandulifera]
MGAGGGSHSSFFLSIFLATFFIINSEAVNQTRPPFNRKSFPTGFVFGAGSAAYQYEGAAFIDGKGKSIWDTFTHQHPEKIVDNSNGDVAIDMYNRYKEDINRMVDTGLDAFRFSIAWSRVLPKGKVSGGVNPIGVNYYNNLINGILAKGLVPYVTLFHWDLPQALEDEYGGFLSDNIVNDYRDYADFCFKTFGDRVKHWFTLNEPLTYCLNGYTTGTHAPGRCSNYIGNCTSGNSATEPYIVAYHLILSHASAVKVYREKYKTYQKGEIGVTLVTHFFNPLTNTASDERAARRALDFWFGWFLHPMTYGDYPEEMKTIIGNRLPRFTAEQSKLLIKSYDFLGVNYYSTYYASNVLTVKRTNLSMSTDNQANISPLKNGVPIGPATDLNWLYIYPKGIYSLMIHIKEHYGNPPIYITENGVATGRNDSLPIKEVLNDNIRIMYHYNHLKYLEKSIQEGANVKGYFMWTFIDDYEWDGGFAYRFGLYFVDYKNGLKRIPKKSAFWYKNFIKK